MGPSLTRWNLIGSASSFLDRFHRYFCPGHSLPLRPLSGAVFAAGRWGCDCLFWKERIFRYAQDFLPC